MTVKSKSPQHGLHRGMSLLAPSTSIRRANQEPKANSQEPRANSQQRKAKGQELKAKCSILILVFAMLSAASAQIVDRMVAVVNRQVVLQSEWDEVARFEFLQQGKPLEQLTSQEMDAVLDRIIDQDLIQQQIVNSSVVEPSADEISSQVRELRSHLPGAAADEKWQSILAVYGLTEQDVLIRVAAQLRILKFLDLRFRTLARVDRNEVSNYYTQTYLPELRKEGATQPPLNQVSDQIQQVLTERRMDELQTSWLQALRSQAQIEKMAVDSNAVAGAKP